MFDSDCLISGLADPTLTVSSGSEGALLKINASLSEVALAGRRRTRETIYVISF